ncbi:MAG: peptidylprolyl isomerase [Oscillospiraceae bacterium]|nr:peptidylprolyl isomerase [Oscillospiraceae bacterium]
MKKIIVFMLFSSVLFSLSGCSTTRMENEIAFYDYSEMVFPLVQLSDISETDGKHPIAVIETSLGVIKIVLFPEYAPNTVGNFVRASLAGFYDDTEILRIQKQKKNPVFFQAGLESERDNKGNVRYDVRRDDNGYAVQSDNEYSVNMWPFKGALGAYSDRKGVSDSRFFVVNNLPLTDEQYTEMREKLLNADGELLLPEKFVDAFEKQGGAITLSGFYTIFGQTIEGYDVIDKICESKTDKNFFPEEDIKIISVTIKNINEDDYKEEDDENEDDDENNENDEEIDKNKETETENNDDINQNF